MTTPTTAPRWRARRRVASREPRPRLPRATADADETIDDDDDDARRLTAALRHARASASAAYSPGAGLGLTPEEQSEAAYADLLDTSLGVVDRDDDEDDDDDGLSADEARAYASGGSMDRASMAMKNDGNAFKTAYELFKALSRGAHIVNDDTGGRGRRE